MTRVAVWRLRIFEFAAIVTAATANRFQISKVSGVKAVLRNLHI
jgi:hypothetical protein